jgi:hypothetical protein
LHHRSSDKQSSTAVTRKAGSGQGHLQKSGILFVQYYYQNPEKIYMPTADSLLEKQTIARK